MNADLKSCLKNINKTYRIFEYEGMPMKKHIVKYVLEKAIDEGFKELYDIPEMWFDNVIKEANEKTN